MRKHLPELALVLVAAAPLFIGLGDQLLETDPAQYAEVARRMVATGDPFSLHDNFGAFLNKPPVTMWLQAVSMAVLGVTSAAARLPSLLAALVLLAVVARIGELLWDLRTGLVAAALLAGSFSLQLMVADPKVDMVVTCTMGLTVWALLEARRRPALLWLAWAFAALGVLTKGPIGLAVPAAAVIPEALRGRWGASGPGGLWSRIAVFKPARGVLLVAAIMTPWYWALVGEHGWGGPRYLIWEQSFKRVLHQSDYHNATTPLFFLHTGLWAFLPFTPLFLYALWQGADGLVRRRALPHDEARVVWWWFLIPFLVISLAEFRLPQYLFWLAPPAALLSARTLSRLAEEGRAKTQRAFSFIGWFLAAASCALGVLILEGAFPPGSRALEAFWIAVTGALPVGLVLFARRWDGAHRLAAHCLASTLGLSVFFAGYVHRELAEFQPDQAFGELARKEDPGGKALPYLIITASNAAAFYAGRPASEVGSVEDLAERVNRKEVTVAVTEAVYLERLRATGIGVEILAERPSFPVSRPNAAFLRAKTRPGAMQRLVMLRLRPDAQQAGRARAPEAAD